MYAPRPIAEDSNAMVYDLLSQLDCFNQLETDFANYSNDSNMPGFQFTAAPSFKDASVAFIPHPSDSPLSHMYSPLSEPQSPLPQRHLLSHSPMHSPMQHQQQQSFEYEADPLVFGSPQMSFDASCLSPPMTPLMNAMLPGSPLMQSYPLIQQSSSKKDCMFKCPCGKSFKKMHSLELHSKLHQQDRAYGCSFCFKRFLRPHDLKRHKITHIDGYKPFECTNCGVNFTRQDAMQRHVNARRCRQES